MEMIFNDLQKFIIDILAFFLILFCFFLTIKP